MSKTYTDYANVRLFRFAGSDDFEDVKFTFFMDPPSGDGWNEPHDPGGPVDIEVVSIAGIPAVHFLPATLREIERKLESDHAGAMRDAATEADAPDPDAERDRLLDDRMIDRTDAR